MWVQHDLLAWTPPARAFDLVSAQFFHLPADLRPRVYGGLADAVAPGGTFLVVAHHPSDLDTTMSRPPVEELFFTADEIAELLDDEWEIQVSEARPRTAKDPDGREVTITDTVLKARRTVRLTPSPPRRGVAAPRSRCRGRWCATCRAARRRGTTRSAR